VRQQHVVAANERPSRQVVVLWDRWSFAVTTSEVKESPGFVEGDPGFHAIAIALKANLIGMEKHLNNWVRDTQYNNCKFTRDNLASPSQSFVPT